MFNQQSFYGDKLFKAELAFAGRQVLKYFLSFAVPIKIIKNQPIRKLQTFSFKELHHLPKPIRSYKHFNK
jgi:hypothetical protein